MSRPTTRVDSSGVTHRILTVYDDDEIIWSREIAACDACRPGWKVIRAEELRRDRDVDCMGCLVGTR